jgi:hypothetical protein
VLQGADAERGDTVPELVKAMTPPATAAETAVSSSSPKLMVSGSSAEHPSPASRGKRSVRQAPPGTGYGGP